MDPDKIHADIWRTGAVPRHQRARGLIDYVASRIPGNGQVAFFDAAQEPDPNLPPDVNRIRIVRHHGLGSSWSCPRFAFDPEISSEKVARTVEKKDGKVKGYRGQYREIWLLMVMGASGPATWGMITGTLRSTRFVSRFNRAFVLGLMDGGFVELDVGYTPASESP